MSRFTASVISGVVLLTVANSPYRAGRAFDRYTIGRELIADAISGRAKELTRGLGYTQDEAKGILVSVLARYRDERSSVSSRREIGML